MYEDRTPQTICEADGCTRIAIGWRSELGRMSAEASDWNVCDNHAAGDVMIRDRSRILGRLDRASDAWLNSVQYIPR
jgi:hypothetical protein